MPASAAHSPRIEPLPIRLLGRVDYGRTFAAMKAWAAQPACGAAGVSGDAAVASTAFARHDFTPQPAPSLREELWICEHDPVYTLGLAGRAAHVLDAGGVPLVASDRGGQVTYHGPGQVVAYPLVDLRRRGLYVKEYVFRLEEAVLRTLAHFGVTGHRVAGAPGVYVRRGDPFSHAPLPQRPQRGAAGGDAHARKTPDFTGLAKIAALGIKVSAHRAYHGVALNVAMDLAPFRRIEPCGYAGLQTVDLSTIGVPVEWDDAARRLGADIAHLLS